MSDGSSYADILILALIAVFILLRLRSVLGDKVGNDNPSYFNKLKQAASQQPQEPIVKLEEKLVKPKPKDEDPYLQTVKDEAIVREIEEMKERDPQFTATAFLQGAKMAYEMVFDAFAKGDRKTLAMLLSEPILATFNSELDTRDASENKTETTLVSVTPKAITEARMEGSVARIGVRFDSEQIIVERDAQGNITQGDASELQDIEDVWVFERNMTSKNPNWKIIET